MNAVETKSIKSYPLSDPLIMAFLTGPVRGFLCGLDDRGQVLTTTWRLRRNPTSDSEGELWIEDVLVPSSLKRWRSARDQIQRGVRAYRVTLKFRGIGKGISYRCLLHRDSDQRLWLLGVPRVSPKLFSKESDRASAESARRINELSEQARRASKEARTDPLTNLPNRRQGQYWLRKASAASLPFSCLFVDLDQFKSINDRFGHSVGDRTLREVAAHFLNYLRPGDRIFRYGGDEFVILLPRTDLDAAAEFATRLRNLLNEQTFPIIDCRLTACFGIAGHQPGETTSELLARADRALLHAKESGPGRIAIAS